MQTTQLACPHCGSMMNVGGLVAPGTPVTCLICSQAFAAAPIASVNVAAKPRPAIPTAPKPQVGIQVSKQPIAPPGRAQTVPQAAKPAPQAAPASGGKGAFLTATLALVILLAAGAGFAIWKLSDVDAAKPTPSIAANQKTGPEPKPDIKPGPAAPAKSKDGMPEKIVPASNGSADDDDPRLKKEAMKYVLKRKPAADPAINEPELDPVPTVHIPAPSVPGVEPARVNAAVDSGIAFLKRTQAANGTWNANAFQLGASALGGLTLLECKVPATDLHVQRVASLVRGSAGNLSTTYEISLAILFLDRLNEAQDRAIIQALALRLLAGQKDCGGWTYDCPLLNAKEMYQLYAFLRSKQPAGKKNKLVGLNGKNPIAGGAAIRELGEMIAEFEAAQNGPADKQEKPKQVRADKLAAQLRTLPVVRNQGLKKGSLELRAVSGATDNSNTQFALLALWAARRYQIVSDVALLTAHQRFEATQFADSTWDYQPMGTPRISLNNTMTCVGLLGLAMGHGVAPEVLKRNPNDPEDIITKPALQDPRIVKGLKALAQYIGAVAADKDSVGPVENMYFIWSLERVAMLYDLNSIDGKDWYGWGAQNLLKHQNSAGSWPSRGYPGDSAHVNTCFALLFLKRSNLVQDLTVHLRVVTRARESDK